MSSRSRSGTNYCKIAIGIRIKTPACAEASPTTVAVMVALGNVVPLISFLSGLKQHW